MSRPGQRHKNSKLSQILQKFFIETIVSQHTSTQYTLGSIGVSGARGLFDATPVHAYVPLKVCTALCCAQGYAEMTPVHRFCHRIGFQVRIATASRWEIERPLSFIEPKGYLSLPGFPPPRLPLQLPSY